ncbi:hypothetical protein M9H77_14570 [Catharanthus roseus]|uniref:Uncharacterized protein n=1 Tax=Catharanthus roseus TaxID=4058 RepID=A0ACC0BNE9_CATRO|nr:hypothetical protein M9H77_14570 [Catharanthus roseus]
MESGPFYAYKKDGVQGLGQEIWNWPQLLKDDLFKSRLKAYQGVDPARDIFAHLENHTLMNSHGVRSEWELTLELEDLGQEGFIVLMMESCLFSIKDYNRLIIVDHLQVIISAFIKNCFVLHQSGLNFLHASYIQLAWSVSNC